MDVPLYTGQACHCRLLVHFFLVHTHDFTVFAMDDLSITYNRSEVNKGAFYHYS